MCGLDRGAEAAERGQALLPRVFAANRRFGTPTQVPLMYRLAAAEQRFHAAAQQLGCTRQRYESQGVQFERNEEAGLASALAAASVALGAKQVRRLVQQGRSLSIDAAEALAAGGAP